jgi:phosphopantetheine--protein transferase-like protein
LTYIGIDLVNIGRVARETNSDIRKIRYLFNDEDYEEIQKYLKEKEEDIYKYDNFDNAALLSKLLAIKEAIYKAVCQMGLSDNVSIKDISVTNVYNMRPSITILHRIYSVFISITTEDNYVISVSIINDG